MQQSPRPRYSIPTAERLIVALDLPSVAKALKLVNTLGDSANFYKIGLELFMTGGYFRLIDVLKEKRKKIFVDLKFFDIPETVRNAIKQLNGRGITFVTVHGNDGIMRAAGKAKGDLLVLAVTSLTSLDQGDLNDLGFDCDVESLVLSRARRAIELGCDGVVASGLEARRLRDLLEDQLLIVTPGIRPVLNDDDQKRVVTLEQAFQNGADYIVVGRPIRDTTNPRAAAESMQQRIATIFR
ncbi:MAG: orotidine-5'-phosphate decarboxylase [Gammaproteobacteria bacterium]|nr:orotidine-5'-phosphate decarboxylase [Gammaproteobacteria bacterium]